MSIDQHIEELRAELRNAVYRDERRWIEDELAMALAEREAMWAEPEGVLGSAPALLGRRSPKGANALPCKPTNRWPRIGCVSNILLLPLLRGWALRPLSR